MEQNILKFKEEESNRISPPVTHIENYLPKHKQDLLLSEAKQYALTSPKIKIFGKEHPIPRLQAWYADDGCDIVYSHLLVKALPWPYYLNRLLHQLNEDFKQEFNGALVNKYQDGQHSMGWHSDNEPEIIIGSDIASISLGVTRDFIIKHKNTKQKYSFSLANGDLLIMHYPMQQEWMHCVPKRQKVVDARFNFTFRRVQPLFHC